MNKIEIIPAIAGFLIALGISYVTKEWTTPAPIQFYERHASKTTVVGSDTVTIYWKEVRDRKCDSIVYRRLISSDGAITNFEPEHEEAKPTGVEVEGKYSFILPVGMSNGLLTYRVKTEFRCNAIQRLFGGHIFIMPDIVFNYSSNEYEEHVQ